MLAVAPDAYRTKKDLKMSVGNELKYEETSMFGEEYKSTGTFCIVGPSKDQRKWFATVTMHNGFIQKVE